ncbi:SDR family oxidoreductase [Adhaeribacter soli]|uniref:SDR family oxidoreductase n=1 Tax=Adhaeribacter soli TaxID=2607655 RepID=A0A5N1J761_9BACT|nr:SDR family oxidoreductase [Adhaeribacter soli]KAA9345953.1 SDR family oxidoreductase [Adhaeribacter soli]
MVVVITGASSGIGRATALRFAGKGWSVVLAARFASGLKEVAEECRQLGGQALAVPTDVAQENEVDALAEAAIATFGGFDVWVNNAAVGLFGRFEEIPMEDIRQLMEINVYGYIYGARAAIRHFRETGEGTLINISSMVALVGQPFSLPYSISKFAVRGLSISLTQELADQKNIHVCCVSPAVIDTPIFQHAANYMGQAVQPPKPVIPAEDVAKAIYKLTKNPREEVIVGTMAKLMKAQRLTLPADLFDEMHQKLVRDQHFQKRESKPSEGNLFSPITNWNRIDGGWIKTKPKKMNRKRVSNTARNASLWGTLLLAGASVAAAWIARGS